MTGRHAADTMIAMQPAQIPGGMSNQAIRLAALGVAGVVACLAAFSIIAAYTIQTQVSRSQHYESLHDIYSAANAALLADEATQLEGLVLPSDEHSAERADADEAVIAAFGAIAAHGDQEDAQLAKDLLRLHEQYLHVYASLATAGFSGDHLEVLRLHDVEDPLYLTMRERIAAMMRVREAEADAALVGLRDTAQWVLILAPAAFLVGFALLFGLWRILDRAEDARRRTYREIEQLSRLRGEFVSIVSHEFRTPLTGVLGFSEMMRDEDLSLPEMKEYAGDINKDARRLTNLINDMLDLDAMESGRLQMQLTPVDLNRIVADAAAQFRSSAAEHPIVLRLAEGLPTLEGESDRLTQVVTNLLSNAIKYSPNGGAIEVQTGSEGRLVTLTVRDHGIGIAAEQLEKIFDRYSRIEADIKGIGLGLAIVSQIVQLHHGSVWATSEAGDGSVFHVRLPLMDSATLAPRAAPLRSRVHPA